jgi:hypothetical protein
MVTISDKTAADLLEDLKSLTNEPFISYKYNKWHKCRFCGGSHTDDVKGEIKHSKTCRGIQYIKELENQNEA